MDRVNQLLRQLPKVGDLLDSEQWAPLLERYSRAQVKAVLEGAMEQWRREIIDGAHRVPSSEALLEQVRTCLENLAATGPRPVLNATGVIIHTNLGRAPLAKAARQAVLAAAGYCNLELDLEAGGRGSRHSHVEALLCRLTGAEAAMVVNNNAAAVLLALSAVARGGEAVISRGQLVEIGGSFRVPEVMEQSGVRLMEVGTTNKTYIEDYRRAITPETKALLRVHPSNYRVVGFQQQVELAEMVELAREHQLPVLDDLGSGTLVDLSPWGVDEPTVQASVAAGADLVCFSGDKLLGGPQCGIAVGSRDLVAKLRQHPLARALRCDKVTLAALAATLALYLKPEGWRLVPVLAMLTEPLAAVEQRAKQLAGLLEGLDLAIAVETNFCPVGGGALPLHRLETRVVRVRPARHKTAELVASLRLGNPPLVARMQDDELLLDVRTLADDQIEAAAAAVAHALEVMGGE